MVNIENWCLIGKKEHHYAAPETITVHLAGTVYGHPLYKDGTEVVTSTIMHTDGKEVNTLNRKYVLGSVRPDFKKWYEEKYQKKFNEEAPFEF